MYFWKSKAVTVSEQRKASDVLLELESKITKLINLVELSNHNYKILSNKLNDLINGNKLNPINKITVEAVNAVSKNISPVNNFQPIDPERQVPIFSESNLPQTNSPQGFRRTSRPETFVSETKNEEANFPEYTPKFPVQLTSPPPGRTTIETVVRPPPEQKTQSSPKEFNEPKNTLMQNSIPVHQRIVDKNGKSIFLADVEIKDLSSGQSVIKTRTNGTGKWMASLAVGNYQVRINKRESTSKNALEAIQDIQVTGSQSPLELNMLIIK